MNRRLVAIALPLLSLLAASVAAVVAARTLLPRTGQVARGLKVEGVIVHSERQLRDLVRARARKLEGHPVTLSWPAADSKKTKTETRTAAEWGMHVDQQAAIRRGLEIARRGSLVFRLEQAWQARHGEIDIPLTWTVSFAPLCAWLAQHKEQLDKPATNARYSFHDRSVIPHRDGMYANPFSTVDDLAQALLRGASKLRVHVTPVAPRVTTDLVSHLDMSQVVGHYETRFGYLGGQANRAHNIATAAARLDGVVVLPGEVLSFNDVVGHRTIENGFAKGWEIFKGEMVEGVGGGTCQTASTLHAAWYLAGLDVIERSPHSRPSGYIPMGLDATVVDGLVDLKIRNPLDFAVVLHSTENKGVIEFRILGETRPRRVTFQADVIGVEPYKRKLRVTKWLPQDKVVRKQKGIRGYTLRRTRTIADRLLGRSWQEVTVDHYPATPEIYLVPPGIDPELDLPPLPFDHVSRDRASRERIEPSVRIVNTRSARHTPPTPRSHVRISR